MGANSAGVTVYVAPGLPPMPVGAFVLATGNSESDLFALGPDQAPVPTRCCAICSGVAYEGVTHTLTEDPNQATPIDSCESFSLHYWDDGILQSWYCVFHDSSASSIVLPDPTFPEPVHHYLRVEGP